MENFDFDNKFKEGLDNLNPMLDNDEIWDNIEPHLKKKKKRRFIIWFFFGMLGVLGLFWLQSTNSSEVSPIAELKSKKELVSDPISKNINNDNTDIEVAVNEAPEIVNEAVSTEPKVQEVTEQKSTSEVQSIVTSQPIIERDETTTYQNKELALPQKNQITKTDRLVFEKSTITEKSDLTYQPDIENQIKNVDVNVEAEESKLNNSPTLEPSLSAIVKKDQIKSGIDFSKEDLIILEEAVPVIDEEVEVKKKLTKKERQEANKKRKEERKKAKREREKKKEEKKKADSKKNKLTKPNKRRQWKHQIQMMGSGIYTLHFLRDQNRSESTYLRHRDRYVSGTEGFGSSFQFVSENPSGLLLTVGMQYQELHEKLERQETISERNLQNVTETITEDADGNIIGSTSSMRLVTTTTTYNQQLYNQYRFVNFPIGLGYAFNSNKMRLKLIGGIDINAYYKFSGSIFNRDLNIIELSSKASAVYDRIYKNSAGMGIWATVEWHKPLNERLSIVVSPGIQAPIKSISQNSEAWPIAHNIVKLRLGVGVNYMLGDGKKSKRRTRKG